MSKVWIIMAGMYSDRHFVGVFSSEEKARELMAKYPEDNDFHDPFEIEVDSLVKDSRTLYSIGMKLDSGDVYLAKKSSIPSRENIFGLILDNIFAADVYADSIEHAIKIVSEKRIMYLANPNQGES